jgi:LPXTG-motif cell wall-anchored protein
VTVGGSTVYVSDAEADRIFQVTGGVVSAYGGTGNLGYSGDGGPALQAKLNLKLSLCGDQGLMQSMNAQGMKTQGDNSVCQFDLPTGVSTSAQLGGVFLSDTDNNHVRGITTGAPPVIPESSYTLLLPLSAVALIGGGYVLFRRRRRHSGPVQVSL